MRSESNRPQKSPQPPQPRGGLALELRLQRNSALRGSSLLADYFCSIYCTGCASQYPALDTRVHVLLSRASAEIIFDVCVSAAAFEHMCGRVPSVSKHHDSAEHRSSSSSSGDSIAAQINTSVVLFCASRKDGGLIITTDLNHD